MPRSSNHTEPANTEHLRTHRRCCEKLTTSNNRRNTDVEEVMASVERGRGNNKRILYLVKWLDYPERKDCTEEPFDNFSVGDLEKLREFHRRNPDAPRDYRLTNA